MTHGDTKAVEMFPTAKATSGINSRHHAGNMVESQTGQYEQHPQLQSLCRL